VLSHAPISGREQFTVRMKKNGPEEWTGQKESKKKKKERKRSNKKSRNHGIP
jgi:hypothetical protein